jgi:DHA1 family inner membrane transport protein
VQPPGPARTALTSAAVQLTLAGTLIGLALGQLRANVATGLLLALIPPAARTPVTIVMAIFLLGADASTLVVCLQMRLMEVAGEAQMLGVALNHSALNAADALGAWSGGLVIAAGSGYTAPGLLGAGFAAAGLLALSVSAVLRRRELRLPETRPELPSHAAQDARGAQVPEHAGR